MSHPIPVKARGIPCYAHVHHFEDELDEYGYTYDLDYSLTDSRDKPVSWIESKMTQRDWDKVDTQIIEYYDALIDEYLG